MFRYSVCYVHGTCSIDVSIYMIFYQCFGFLSQPSFWHLEVRRDVAELEQQSRSFLEEPLTLGPCAVVAFRV